MTDPRPSVRIRAIPAHAGLNWIRLALRAFGRQPAGFMGMFGLFLAAMLVFSLPVSMLMPLASAIHLNPVVVAMLSLVLMPLLTLSFMLSTQAVTNDQRIRPSLFFAPLRGTSGERRSLLAIGGLYVAMFLVAWYLGNGLDNGEATKWFNDRMMPPAPGATPPPVLAPLGSAAQLVMLLKVAVVALVTIPLWHAPALVHWGRYGAAKAMFASIVALWRTRAAMLVFGLGWFALSFVVTSLLAVLELLLGGSMVVMFLGLLMSWMLTALFYVTLWFGFVDTFEITAPVAYRTVMADPPV